MATRYTQGAQSGLSVTASTQPQFLKINASGDAMYVFAYDAATSEAAVWQDMVIPQGWTGTGTLIVYGVMASGTSGNIVLRAYVEAITPGDASPTPATASSFDVANSSGASAVPGTLSVFSTSITLTNFDGGVAGDLLRIKIDRDAANGSDTATGDFYLTVWELRDAA